MARLKPCPDAPIPRVNVDLTASMLRELDEAATEMNVGRQAAIKILDQRALVRQSAQQARRSAVSVESKSHVK